MAQRNRPHDHANNNSTNSDTETAETLRRIANVLALLAVKDLPQRQQILTLSNAGFTPKEIAALLNTTPNNVNVRLSEHRSQQKSKGKAGANAE